MSRRYSFIWQSVSIRQSQRFCKRSISQCDSLQSSLLRYDRNRVAYLTLNRPKARNALSLDLIRKMKAELLSITQDKSVRVVVLKGSTGPAFCSGHDLKELQQLKNQSIIHCEEVFSSCSSMMQQLLQLPQPVIAQVHGIATAAGCQLVATCDLAIAEENAEFAVPGVNIGLFCSTPSVALVRAVGKKAALRMLLTGENINAVTAKEIGLINSIVSPDALEGEVVRLAEKIAGKSAESIALGKRFFNEQVEKGVSEAYDLGSTTMARNLFLDDAKEGIAALLEKRSPIWK
jgi:enoyl-CoA hydratase/carnithine racemase